MLDKVNVRLVIGWLVLKLFSDGGMNVHAFNLPVAVRQECEGYKFSIRQNARNGLIGVAINVQEQMLAAIEMALLDFDILSIDYLMRSNFHFIAFCCPGLTPVECLN